MLAVGLDRYTNYLMLYCLTSNSLLQTLSLVVIGFFYKFITYYGLPRRVDCEIPHRLKRKMKHFLCRNLSLVDAF